MTLIVGRVFGKTVTPALSEMKSNGHLAHGLAVRVTAKPSFDRLDMALAVDRPVKPQHKQTIYPQYPRRKGVLLEDKPSEQ